MDNIEYLFAVFAVIWILVFFYIALMIRRQQRIKKEIEILEETLSQRKA
ncbi:conserved hypothetical protein [Dehalogenimonas lykanthroporepellens BL-DC-9]|jgi:CcmD family protein|nr:conserved hypothetical protein [Dehalogenimonas lykanthroporepellens BL-DC-9]